MRIWIAVVLALLLSLAAMMYVKTRIPYDQLKESVDFIEFGADRSSQWTTVRNKFVKEHPVCEACGSNENLNVHHIKPFHSNPELELEWSNLITLCREHHFYIGHDPDGPNGPLKPNWKESNPNVRRDAAEFYLAL